MTRRRLHKRPFVCKSVAAKATAAINVSRISPACAAVRTVAVAVPIAPIVIVVGRYCNVRYFLSVDVEMFSAQFAVFVTFCADYRTIGRGFVNPFGKNVRVLIDRYRFFAVQNRNRSPSNTPSTA